MQQTPYDESKEGVIRAPDYVPQLHLLAVARPWEIHNGCDFLRSAGITPLTLISRSSLWVQSRVVGHHFFLLEETKVSHISLVLFVLFIEELDPVRPYGKICDSALDLIGFTP